MGTTSSNLHEQYIKDADGNETVVIRLRPEEFEKIRGLLKNITGDQAVKDKTTVTFDSIYGMALKAPLNPNPRFKNDDDLWEHK